MPNTNVLWMKFEGVMTSFVVEFGVSSGGEDGGGEGERDGEVEGGREGDSDEFDMRDFLGVGDSRVISGDSLSGEGVGEGGEGDEGVREKDGERGGGEGDCLDVSEREEREREDGRRVRVWGVEREGVGGEGRREGDGAEERRRLDIQLKVMSSNPSRSLM